jgi:hypothetical protein
MRGVIEVNGQFPRIFVADFHPNKGGRGFGFEPLNLLPKGTGGTIKVDAVVPYGCEFKVTIPFT